MDDVGRTGPDPDARNVDTFHTERLSIELPTVDDADELYRLIGGPDRDAICATLSWDGPDDRSDTEWWAEQCRTATYADWGFHWVIRDRSGRLSGRAGRAMGAIGTRPTGIPGRADDELGYAKMEATVFAHNEAGRCLVERCGFEQEGLIRRGHRKRGAWVDCAIYGLLLP